MSLLSRDSRKKGTHKRKTPQQTAFTIVLGTNLSVVFTAGTVKLLRRLTSRGQAYGPVLASKIISLFSKSPTLNGSDGTYSRLPRGRRPNLLDRARSAAKEKVCGTDWSRRLYRVLPDAWTSYWRNCERNCCDIEENALMSGLPCIAPTM